MPDSTVRLWGRGRVSHEIDLFDPDSVAVWGQSDIAHMFQRLNTRRKAGFSSPEPIPLSDMKLVLDEWEVTDRDERRRLINLLCNMDRVFLHVLAERRSAEAPKK